MLVSLRHVTAVEVFLMLCVIIVLCEESDQIEVTDLHMQFCHPPLVICYRHN